MLISYYTSHKNEWNSYRLAHYYLMQRVPLQNPIYYYEQYQLEFAYIKDPLLTLLTPSRF